MKLANKIEIDILEFFRTGKFDYIKLGHTKEWIRNNFPDPDYEEFKENIWQYGNIEFHFNNDQLCLLFSDYLNELNGGESLKLHKWILNEPHKLTLLYVIQKLNEEKIDFTIIHNKTSQNVVDIEIIKSRVKLGFINCDESSINPNLFMLNCFSLHK